jgi:DNA-directed RNA polymerase subunit RPC12/RpoP
VAAKPVEEMVFSKLKHGSVFACPRCGSRTFKMIRPVKVRFEDVLRFSASGAEICFDNPPELRCCAPSLKGVSRILCRRCGREVSKNRIAGILRRVEVSHR